MESLSNQEGSVGPKDGVSRWVGIIASIIMAYVLIGGAVGIQLKNSYPPLNECRWISRPWFDPFCPSTKMFSDPAMGALVGPALLVDTVARTTNGHGPSPEDMGIIVQLALIAFIPLGGLATGCFLFLQSKIGWIALTIPILTIAELLWYGLTGVYGIT